MGCELSLCKKYDSVGGGQVSTVLMWNYDGGGGEVEIFNMDKSLFERFLPVLDGELEKAPSGYVGKIKLSESVTMKIHFATGLETEFVNPVDVEVQRRLDDKFIESFPSEEDISGIKHMEGEAERIVLRLRRKFRAAKLIDLLKTDGED